MGPRRPSASWTPPAPSTSAQFIAPLGSRNRTRRAATASETRGARPALAFTRTEGQYLAATPSVPAGGPQHAGTGVHTSRHGVPRGTAVRSYIDSPPAGINECLVTQPFALFPVLICFFCGCSSCFSLPLLTVAFFLLPALYPFKLSCFCRGLSFLHSPRLFRFVEPLSPSVGTGPAHQNGFYRYQ